ncbi:hypothetical protein NL676_002907 [Syzygium grande]|nr:hypothetical protein NL676_002907 [Syzygium grande]
MNKRNYLTTNMEIGLAISSPASAVAGNVISSHFKMIPTMGNNGMAYRRRICIRMKNKATIFTKLGKCNLLMDMISRLDTDFGQNIYGRRPLLKLVSKSQHAPSSKRLSLRVSSVNGPACFRKNRKLYGD